MSTRQVLGAVGAAVGGFFFGPQGAQWGWAIGSVVGGAVDPQVIKGPSVGDLAAQTSQEGISRPIVFALSQPMGGNIIASGPPRIVKRSQRQGKGGPKVETESVYRTYAMGVCEGPIGRFVRVWRNNQLVYDGDNTAMSEDASFSFLGNTVNVSGANSEFLNKARFFLGDFDQLPSPDLEHIFGVGTTPAHRGTAYMVMADEDLTDFRGAIPQWTFQVSTCEPPATGPPFIEFTAGEDPLNPGVTYGYVDGTYAFTGGIGAAMGTLINRTPDQGFVIAGATSRNSDPPETQQVFQVAMVGPPNSPPPFDLFTYCDVYKNGVLTWRLEDIMGDCFPDPDSCVQDAATGVRVWIWSTLPLGTDLIENGDVIRVEFFTGVSPGPFP